MSKIPMYLDIPLTDEDRRIWDRMPYFAARNYMKGHTMDAAIFRSMTYYLSAGRHTGARHEQI